MDYTTNAAGETGEPVPDQFEYSSATNPHFLTVEELRELNNRV
jgi:UDP-N-acetylglucosamine 4,6-dehydratase